jgi:hypothetical protein
MEILIIIVLVVALLLAVFKIMHLQGEIRDMKIYLNGVEDAVRPAGAKWDDGR